MMVIRLIPPIAIIMAALGLIFLGRSSTTKSAGALFYLDLIAQIALWLGAAWLARRAIGVALHGYSARKGAGGGEVEGGPNFLETGRHLLTDLIGLIIFEVAGFARAKTLSTRWRRSGEIVPFNEPR
jgi:hypothetical protein